MLKRSSIFSVIGDIRLVESADFTESFLIQLNEE